MWVVVCQDGDPDADWIGEKLRERGLEPLEVVTSSILAHQATWEHRIGADGVRTVLRLENGEVIDSAAVRGVLNRLVRVSAAGYQGASEQDREYAGMELHALALSWLAGLGHRAMNRAAPVGLAGAWRPVSHWRWLAHAAGLATAGYHSSDGTDTHPARGLAGVRALLVVDGQAVTSDRGDGLPEVDAASLAAAFDLDMFEAVLRQRANGEWELLDVNPVPPLWTRGDAAAAAIAEALRRRSGFDDPALRHS